MPDQVTIKFGPAKLNTPKAIRNSIADTATQTKSDTIAEVTNNTSINVGGSVTGTVAQVATITTFDPYTNTGTATFNLDGINLNYVNATGSYLNPADEVVILEDTNKDYTAVAVYQRMPSVPGSIPAAGIAPGFPIDVTNAANKMTRVPTYGAYSNITCKYDEQGIYSGNSDTILNLSAAQYNTPYILNGYSRSISQSISTGLSIYESVGSNTSDIHFQTNGRVWIHQVAGGPSSQSFKYKDPGSNTFVNSSDTGFLPAGHTYYRGLGCDPTNGWVWFTLIETSTGNIKLYYVEPTMPFSYTLSQTFTSASQNFPSGLFADNGYLYLQMSGNYSNYALYRKSSSNTSAATNMCTTAGELYNMFYNKIGLGKLAGSIDGKLSVIRDSETNGGVLPPTVFIDTYSTGGKSSFDTGLPYVSSGAALSRVDGIAWSPSGFLVITFATSASYFGMGTGTEWLPGVMITNFSSIAYPFVDPSMMTSTYNSSYNQVRKVGNTNIAKRSDGSMIWVTSIANPLDSTATLWNGTYTLGNEKTRIYEITGL